MWNWSVDVISASVAAIVLWGQQGAHLGPVSPRWAPYWPHEPCYQGCYNLRDEKVWASSDKASVVGATALQAMLLQIQRPLLHDVVIKWNHFPRHWPFVRGIHRSPVNHTHKGQWRGALMIFLICARINGWVNNGEAGDLRRYRVHGDVIVMANMHYLKS